MKRYTRQSSIASVCIDGSSQTSTKNTNSTDATSGWNSTPPTTRHGHERRSGLSQRRRQRNGRPARSTLAGYEAQISSGVR